MQTRSRVRTVYLYGVSLLGIVLLTIGTVRLVDLGLKALVFTGAEEDERFYAMQPPPPPVRIERLGVAGEADLDAEERAMLRQWIADYRLWKERTSRIDPVSARRQRTASSSLALVLIGLPLYLYHWRLVRREVPDGPAGNGPSPGGG